MDRPPGLYNIFSNVWFFFGYNNQEHEHILRKVRATHGITKSINIDDICKFWPKTNTGETFTTEIAQQITLEKRAKLTKAYTYIKSQIDMALRATNPESAPTVLCVYTMTPDLFECLIGAYLHYLNKTAAINLANSAKALSSKIYGVDYQMTEEMKQFLYLTCS